MSEMVLVGPFLTRAQAARLAGASRDEMAHRPDLLRVGGTWAEEVYFAWQFDSGGVRPGVGRAVKALKALSDDVSIADWFFRRAPDLGEATPMAWLVATGDVEAVILAFKETAVLEGR